MKKAVVLKPKYLTTLASLEPLRIGGLNGSVPSAAGYVLGLLGTAWPMDATALELLAS